MKSYKRLAFRLGAAGAALALSTLGLIAVTAPPASGATITETFAGTGPTGALEQQVGETINQPASVTQGNSITIALPGSSQTVPTTDSSVTLNYIYGLTTIIPVPANATFVPGSIVVGTNGSYTPSGGGASTAVSLTVTYCTATTGAGTACSASPNSSTFAGNTLPYLEATTGSTQFLGGGSLQLPDWSFQVTATGSGSIVSTVSEFDTGADISLVAGSDTPLFLALYPAAPQAACLGGTGTCDAGVYQDQPIATTTILSPPAAPVLQPQTTSVSAGPGQCTTINPLTGSTDTGTGDAANPTSVQVTSTPTNGTATVNATTGIITYCNNGGTSLAADTFTVTAADTLANPALVSLPVTETVNISYNQCSAGSGNPGGGSAGSLTGCNLHQEIVLPVQPGQIILSQSSGLPLDYLGSAFCPGGTGPLTGGIVLNGNEQAACGAVSPMTVTNATGLDSGWTLTGQVTDFNDPADPSLTCDSSTAASNAGGYNNHCIPGGNLAWVPAGGVASSIVPGDTAQVTPGNAILPFAPVSPAVSLNPILQGSSVQPNPVVEPAPNAGLHTDPETLCSTAAGQSGGTFVCAAGLELVVPASVAEPAVGAFGAPAYQASLTLTLS